MKNLLFLVLFISVFSSCNLEEEPPIVKLSEDISELITSTQGTFAVAFADLKTGDTLFINAREKFHAASTMKTPVMIELYKQQNKGNFKLEDSIMVKTEFTSIVDGSPYTMDINEDSETVLYEKVGSMVPIKELMYEMITRSSNLSRRS